MQASRKRQEEWAEREADIDKRLKIAHDKVQRSLPADLAAAEMERDSIDEERDNFFTARAIEKKEAEEARLDAKRKYESDLTKQRAYNKAIKGEGRKKFKAALQAKRDDAGCICAYYTLCMQEAEMEATVAAADREAVLAAAR